MTMSINVGSFDEINNKLSADYELITKGPIVTDTIDHVLSSSIKEFSAYEDNEEIIYKEINECKVNEIMLHITDVLLSYLKKIEESGCCNCEEFISDMRDLLSLNCVFVSYLQATKTSTKPIKLLVV